jgi:hypothetical protein
VTARIIPVGTTHVARRVWQQVTGRLPYAWSIRLQRAGVQLQRYTRSARYREAIRLSRAILPPGPAAGSVRATALGALTGSSFTGWRLRALARLSPDALARAVRLVGGDRLPTPNGTRGGAVLVNSRMGAGICVPLALGRLGYDVCSVEGMDHLDRAGLRRVPGVRVLDLGPEGTFRLPHLRAAMTVLQRGGLVHTAGDGERGTGGVRVTFRGRSRSFGEGFAALAVLAGVPVLPVFARMDARGGIEIEILPPLADDPTVQDRRARARLLVEAYVRLLETRWSLAPAEVLIPSMRAYARLPTPDAEAVAGRLAGPPRPAEGGVWDAS